MFLITNISQSSIHLPGTTLEPMDKRLYSEIDLVIKRQITLGNVSIQEVDEDYRIEEPVFSQEAKPDVEQTKETLSYEEYVIREELNQAPGPTGWTLPINNDGKISLL
jgi:hypothetical protein